MPLTHTIINKLAPSEKCTPSRPDKHSDGDGLQLWVRHTGNMSYAEETVNINLGDYNFNPTLNLFF